MKDEAYETIQKKLQTFLSSAPRNKDVGITGYVMDMMQHDDSKTAKHIFDALDFSFPACARDATHARWPRPPQ